MDADPTTDDQGPSGVDDAISTPLDTECNQQITEMLPGIGDASVSTPVEDVTAQEDCQSISDFTQEDNLNPGDKADNNMELNPEDTNVRLK